MASRNVRGSRSGRPIMVLLDALGKRWALRVLWELSAGALSFRALQSACEEVSPTVLNQRLKELKELGLVELGAAGYQLTGDGAALGEKLVDLDVWARRWAKRRGE